MKTLSITACFCLIFVTHSFAQVDQANEQKIESLKLETVFNDDFSTDSRSDYETEGDIEWKQGLLTLQQGSAIERLVPGSPWVKFAIGMDVSESEGDQVNSELRLWFQLPESTDCYLRLQKKFGGTQPSWSIALVDTGEIEGEAIEQVVRELEFQNAWPGILKVQYRHGLVIASGSTGILFAAFVPNGDTKIRSIKIESENGVGHLNHYMVEAFKSKSQSFTEEQQKRLLEAEQATEMLAQLYQQGKYADAAKVGEKILELRKSVLDLEHPDYTVALVNLAALYYSMGEHAKAEPLYKEACGVSKRVMGIHHPVYATSLNNLAALYFSMGQYAKAEPLYERSTAICKLVLGEEHLNYASSLNNLAMLYEWMGQYAKAEPFYIKARDIRKKVLGEEDPEYAASLGNLAGLYESMGQYSRAEPLYVQSCKIRKTTLGEDHPSYATHLSNLALLYYSMGQYSQAEPLYLQVRDICKNSLGVDHPSYAASLNNLAMLYGSMGDYSRAESLYIMARDLRKKELGEEHPDYATSLNNLASLYESMGEFARAESCYIEARDIRKKTLGEEHPDYATSLNNLAVLYRLLGDYRRAETLYEEAFGIRKKSLGEDHPDLAASANGLGVLYRSMEEYDQAELMLLFARDIRAKALGKRHPSYANTLNNLAALYESMGKYESAESLYREAHEIFSEVLGEDHPYCTDSLSNLAGLYDLLDDHARAESIHLSAFESQVEIAAKLLPAMSEAQASRWSKNNGPQLDLVLANLRRLKNSGSFKAYHAVWQTKLASSRLRVGQTIAADVSSEANETFNQLRDARLRLAKLVSATPNPEQAEEYRKNLAEANEAKERLEKKLAEINPPTEHEISIRDSRIEDLQKALPGSVAIVDLVKVNDWKFEDKEITLLQNDGAKVTRTVKKEKVSPVYDAFVTHGGKASQVHWVQLGDAEPIDAAISRWRAELTGENGDRGLKTKSVKGSDNKSKSMVDPRELLRNRLWEPLEPHLKDCHTVIILADGDLHRLPWAALPGTKPDSFLIEDYAISTASYGQQLIGFLTAEQPSNSGLFVAGGIQYDQKPPSVSVDQFASRTIDVSDEQRSWPFLEGTDKEANAIAEFWTNSGSIYQLKGLEAEEHKVAKRLEKSRYAHLATHGFFDKRAEVYRVNLREQSLFESVGIRSMGGTVAARNPLLMTGIVLAGANVEPAKNDLGLPIGDDGILTAEEIVGLNLRNTELVTLSACETGLGDVAAGEGVFGLQRALHQAGARSVVASLWKVSDKATQALMVEFYKNLWEKKMSKVEALRQAQITMLKRYDTEAGKLRGLGEKSVKANGKSTGKRLSPRYWAAFVLSGDWR